MLFAYTYVPHKMDKMRGFIDFIFYEVWCKAPAGGPFSLHLFDANVELREVMEAFYYSDKQGADFFYGHVERIYGLFSELTVAQINQFQQGYQGNNDLEKVCANDPAALVVRYADIAINHKDLGEQLGVFFKGLYTQSLNLAALRDKIGEIDDHYLNFISTNSAGKCPFCGIGDIKGTHHSKREAYDHYLPKSLYPFNSINFRNLVPACHECNGTYKLAKDPVHSPVGGRRKAFNPYGEAGYTIELQVTLQNCDIEKLTPANISLEFGPAAINEEIDTWKNVYGIEERYKAKFCGENDGKYWLVQVLDECIEFGTQPVDALDWRAQQAKKWPYADCNFLRKPFLDACRQIGIF